MEGGFLVLLVKVQSVYRLLQLSRLRIMRLWRVHLMPWRGRMELCGVKGWSQRQMSLQSMFLSLTAWTTRLPIHGLNGLSSEIYNFATWRQALEAIISDTI